MNLVKDTLKRLINASGFELRRLKPKSNPAYQLLIGLKAFDIDLVFDVGANAGQFLDYTKKTLEVADHFS